MPARLHLAIFNSALLAIGAGGGFVAYRLGLPMPWLSGALLVTALGVAFLGDLYPRGYVFPQWLRLAFIGMIGVLIGTQIERSLLAQLPLYAVSLTGVAGFVIAAQFGNFVIFRRIGGLDPATAWFSGSPGGLIEALTMGEAQGADLRMLTLLQFLRIIVVVTALPLALSLWHGHPVGSAAGMRFGEGISRQGDAIVVLLLALAGAGLGRLTRLPAWQLTGPLVVSGLAGSMGWVALAPPGWMIQAAQVVVGVSLGTRFVGIGRRILFTALGMSLTSVAFMLALGAGIAGGVHVITGREFEVLFIAMAPGGVTEMALVALSLAANPAFVTLHHLFRIVLTVSLLALARRLGILPSGS